MDLTSIAFIPDGNRRYAKSMNKSPIFAYQIGTQKAWEVLNWLEKYPSIKVGSFYTLSLENLSRTKAELSVLFKIFEKELNKVKEGSIFETNQVKLKFIGRTQLFPKKIQELMAKAEEFTADFKNKTINMALAYNGQAEIVDAAKKIAEQYKSNGLDLEKIDMQEFKKYLYNDCKEPDLIVRTGAVQRLSGFLTYQSAYSEFYFLDKYWPEFSEADLGAAVQEYNERQRRFGK